MQWPSVVPCWVALFCLRGFAPAAMGFMVGSPVRADQLPDCTCSGVLQDNAPLLAAGERK